MKAVWIIGAGRFGQLAASRLNNRFLITLVDPDQSALDESHITGMNRVCADGIDFLTENLTRQSDVAWIVPCLPVHMAWEWCRSRLGKNRLIPVNLPKEIQSLLPNAVATGGPHAYASHADFICPDNCNEPDAFCTHTKQPRKQDMYSLVDAIDFKDFAPLVLKSRQLAPGVGGIRPEDLFQLLHKIKTADGHLIVCTACRCHAVITGAMYQPEMP